MGKYHVDPHKVALKRSKDKTNKYLNKSKRIHGIITFTCSILILILIFGFTIVLPIASVFIK